MCVCIPQPHDAVPTLSTAECLTSVDSSSAAPVDSAASHRVAPFLSVSSSADHAVTAHERRKNATATASPRTKRREGAETKGPSGASDEVRRLYALAKEQEQQFSATVTASGYAHTGRLSEVAVEQKQHLVTTLSRILLQFPAVAWSRHVENKLWMLHYRLLEPLFQKVHAPHSGAQSGSGGVDSSSSSSSSSSEQQEIWRARLGLLIQETSTTISELLSSLLQQWCETHIAVAAAANERSQSSSSHPLLPSEQVSAARSIASSFLISLGDLRRYHESYLVKPMDTSQVDWSSAIDAYTRALSLTPGCGKVHNQLAVIASYQKNDFEALYQYVRAIHALEAFPARENLLSLFEQQRRLPLFSAATQSSSSSVSPPTASFSSASSSSSSAVSVSVSSLSTSMPVGLGLVTLKGVSRYSEASHPPPAPRRNKSRGNKLTHPPLAPSASVSDLTRFLAYFVRLQGVLFSHTNVDTSFDTFFPLCTDHWEAALEQQLVDDALLLKVLVLCIASTASVQIAARTRSSPDLLSTRAATLFFALFTPILRRCVKDLKRLPHLPVISVAAIWLRHTERTRCADGAHPSASPSSLLYLKLDTADVFRTALARLVNSLVFEQHRGNSASVSVDPASASAAASGAAATLSNRMSLRSLLGFGPLESCPDWRSAVVTLDNSALAQTEATRDAGHLLFFDKESLRFGALPFADKIVAPLPSFSLATLNGVGVGSESCEQRPPPVHFAGEGKQGAASESCGDSAGRLEKANTELGEEEEEEVVVFRPPGEQPLGLPAPIVVGVSPAGSSSPSSRLKFLSLTPSSLNRDPSPAASLSQPSNLPTCRARVSPPLTSSTPPAAGSRSRLSGCASSLVSAGADSIVAAASPDIDATADLAFTDDAVAGLSFVDTPEPPAGFASSVRSLPLRAPATSGTRGVLALGGLLDFDAIRKEAQRRKTEQLQLQIAAQERVNDQSEVTQYNLLPFFHVFVVAAV